MTSAGAICDVSQVASLVIRTFTNIAETTGPAVGIVHQRPNDTRQRALADAHREVARTRTPLRQTG